MATYSLSFIIFLVILNVMAVFASREIPTTANAKDLDKKQPQSFIGQDGSVLIPGLGRYLLPKPGSHYDPISYNPITGHNDGNGATIPGTGGDPSSGYVPGGDDTLVPNPGVEVPAGGGVPVPPSP